MKKIIYSLFFAFAFFQITSNTAKAQGLPDVAVDLFCETFDTIPELWKMTRSNVPASRPDSFRLDTIVTKDGSYGAASDTSGDRNDSYLTSPLIDVVGFTSVGVSFDHICYVDQFDDAVVEYSFDKGVTWTRLPDEVVNLGNATDVYNGQSVYDFGQGDYKFCKASRAVKWLLVPVDDTTRVWGANTDAWVTENFDLSVLIATNPTPVDSIQLRFGLIDDPASSPGRSGTHRWIIDNFCVRGADCELVPPTVELKDPPRDYVKRYEGRVYQTPPYTFDAKILDNKGVDTAYAVVEIRRDTAVFPAQGEWKFITIDTIPGIRFPGNNFEFVVPRLLPRGDSIQLGDSVWWKIEAVDKSDCRNMTQDPPEGLSKFLVINNLPKSCGTQPIFDYPYYETFEATGFVTGRSGILANDWLNIKGDFHDWWVNSGITQTEKTGPSDSYPPGGKYLYVESTNFVDSTAFMLSPCIDLSSDRLVNGLVRFYLNMNTNSITDSVRVDLFDPTPTQNFPFGRFRDDIIPPVTGNKGDNWIPFEFSTFPFRNTVTQLRFRGTPGTNSGFGDMALDSFKIVPAPLIDLRLNPVTLTPYSPEGVKDTVTVNVQNLGVADATAATFGFRVELDDGTIIPGSSESWTGVLKPGESMDIKLKTLTYDNPFGEFSLITWLTFAGDNSNSNDTTFTRSLGLANKIGKYSDNFDGEVLWNTLAEDDTLKNKWELGTPEFDATYSAYSPPNAWDIMLIRPYTGTGVTVSLLSPFMDFGSHDSTIMSFLNNRDIDTTKDGVWIEYSFDRGISWARVTALKDPLQKRWYNSTLSEAGLGGTPVFADRSNCYEHNWSGWLESEVLLPDTFDRQKEVLFRFNFFAADDDDGNDGLSMDNFLVYDPTLLDLEPQHYFGPNSRCALLKEQRISTVIKNRGLDAVNSFEIQYKVTHIPTNTVETKTDVINRTILTRDTLHVISDSKFDMFRYGDYEVEITTILPNDGCLDNNTMTRLVENVEGCSLRFQIKTASNRIYTRQPCDSMVWEFNYTSGDRDYRISKAYNDAEHTIGTAPGFVINDLFVCIKDDSQVEFRLNDEDDLVSRYSFIAFNGENDTVVRGDVRGGNRSPKQDFKWNCPPERSVTPVAILLNGERPEIPKAQEYDIDAIILNNGLDSLDSVRVTLIIDTNPPVLIETNNFTFVPNDISYNRRASVYLGKHFLAPGTRTLRVITSLPNGQVDLLKGDDTLTRIVTFLDTIVIDTSFKDTLPRNPLDTFNITRFGFCEGFEDTITPLWVGLSTNAYKQRVVSFERGSPSTPNISSAFAGSNAWVTNLDGDHPNIDTSSVISPYYYLKKDSCYQLSFWHNYHITDSIHDGGQVQISYDDGDSWETLGTHEGDTVKDGQQGWYNRKHILSIKDNTQNAGWSGVSNGWTLARNTLPPLDNDQHVTFRWRFQSDGSFTSDGWAIDEVCIGTVNTLDCFPVGVREIAFDKSKLYLGQNIPNPADYTTSIPYFLPKSGEVEFVVVNLLGQPVYYEKGNKPYGNGVLELDVSNLSKGVYYYWMMFGGERVTNKMVIAK